MHTKLLRAMTYFRAQVNSSKLDRSTRPDSGTIGICMPLVDSRQQLTCRCAPQKEFSGMRSRVVEVGEARANNGVRFRCMFGPILAFFIRAFDSCKSPWSQRSEARPS
jgi:hypothetical protein